MPDGCDRHHDVCASWCGKVLRDLARALRDDTLTALGHLDALKPAPLDELQPSPTSGLGGKPCAVVLDKSAVVI